MKRIINISLIAVLLTLLCSIPALSQVWTSMGNPQIAKNVKDITVDNSGSNLYISDNDYLLKSINGGTAWKGTGSNFATPSLVLCKPDVANIVIGSKQNFFKLSTDGGNSWNNVTPPEIAINLTPLRLSASPVNTSNMFLGRKYDASTKSVWRSLYSGSNWEPCNNFIWATDVYDVAPYPVSGVGRDQELWVCGSVPGGINKQSPRSTSALASDRGVWYSNNSGANWQAYTMGDFNLRSIAVVHKTSPTNPHLYAATSDGEIYKSTDYSISWSLNYSTGKTVRVIRVNNFNNVYIFLATNNGVYRSTDEGTTWSTANTGLGTDLDVLSLAIKPLSTTIIIGTANTIYKSTDNGNTWIEVGKMNLTSHKLSR